MSKKEHSSRNKQWGDWVRMTRKLRHITQRSLAEISGIDSSYITLIERDGAIPHINKVRAIGIALGQPEDLALTVAGFVAPERRDDFLCLVMTGNPLNKQIPREISNVVNLLLAAPIAKRKEVIAIIKACFSGGRDDENRDKEVIASIKACFSGGRDDENRDS